MSQNIPCKVFTCSGCEGPIDTKKVRNDQRRYNIRRKARAGKPTKHRYEPAIRRELILKAALIAASRPGGWSKLTRQAIAKEAGCSDALVSHSLGNMPTVRRAIMRAAIRMEICEIIAQSVLAHDGYAVRKWLPAALKHKAISSLLDK